MSDDNQGCLPQQTQSVGAPCIETESTEPSGRFPNTNLAVWAEASEISVYQLSHAADFSPPHRDSTPTHGQTQQEIR